MKKYLEDMVALIILETGYWLVVVGGMFLFVGLNLWTGIGAFLLTGLFYLRMKTHIDTIRVFIDDNYVDRDLYERGL